MQYIATKAKPVDGQALSKNVMVNAAKRLSTGRLIMIIITRHKVGLLTISNGLLLITFIFPPWFDILKSLIF